ncbi:heparan-alpha-glucosaminide N-acetyltransferase domain-containing protein [Agromyces humatus]|uniref:DUF418 domain-containing protein n=1 Tax=Agromyces humatus TaxID=279573 RepID=A0ABN2K8Q3_9MICO|nr:heparan-alpha-glucosaminide N-acetyltransferase domain-containing protein [Agromyces humatus]
MADRAPAATPAARVDGVDAARGLALIGMFIAHVSPAAASADLTSLIALADERPRLLFALTAGMGLGFITGATRPLVEGRGRLRSQIAIRAVILIILGLGIALTLHPLVFIILDVYGVAFLLLLPLLFLPRGVVLGAGIVALAVAPALAELAKRTAFVAELDASSLGFVADWFVSGAYPVLVWVAVMLIGLALVRYDLGSPRVVAVAALIGTYAAATLLPVAALMPGGNAAAAIDALGADAPVSATTTEAVRLSIEAVGNVGFGVLVVAAMLLLLQFAVPPVRRVARLLLSPITAMGAMPLSVYTVHLLVITAAVRTENGVRTDDSWELLIALIVGSMLFAWLWRRYIGRGPLEQLLRWASGRRRADVTSRT